MQKVTHKQKFLVCLLITMSALPSLFAADTNSRFTWDFKLSNTYQEGGFRNFRAEGYYVPIPCLEAGIYMGYSGDDSYDYHHTYGRDNNMLHEDSPNHKYALHFGAQLNFHPISLWLKKHTRKPRLDAWLGLKIGYIMENYVFLPGDYYYIMNGQEIWYSRDKKTVKSRLFIESALALGVAYNFKIGLGLYVEYAYGIHPYNRNYDIFTSNVRWGISYAF